MKNKLILGIDTARGWAVVENKKVIAAGTIYSNDDLTKMMDKVIELSQQYKFTEARIERPKNKKPYQRQGQSKLQMLKIAVNVGENYSKATALHWLCDYLGIPAVFIDPIRGGTKLSKEKIKQITGFCGQSSEHSRDAIMIAFL